MSELVDCSLYQGLIKSDLPEILNDKENRLENLRYLVLTAIARCDPLAVAKNRFSLTDLQEIAAHLRLSFDFYHGALKILEEVLIPAGLVTVTESEGKPRYHYSITEKGWDEVLKRMEVLRTLAQVIEFKRKIVLGKAKRIENPSLPKNLVGLLSGDSLEDLDFIKEKLVKDLQLT
jgi:hypothetical protein